MFLIFGAVSVLFQYNGVNPLNLRSFIPNTPLLTPQDGSEAHERIAKIKSSRADAMRNVIWGFASLFGIIFAIVGIFNSIHRTQQKDLDLSHEENSQLAARRIADSDLFSSGVTKLGAPEPEIQVGGLYELEFLAKADLENSLTDASFPIAIKNTIASFIRLKSSTEDADRSALQTAAIVLSRTFANLHNFSNASGDHENDFDDRLNLRGANFSTFNFPSGMNFRNIDLTGADFSSARLVKATFDNTNLSGSNFIESNLTLARITNSELTNSSLEDAILQNTDFTSSYGLTPQMMDSASIKEYNNLVGLSPTIVNFLKNKESTKSQQNDENGLKTHELRNEYLDQIKAIEGTVDSLLFIKVIRLLGPAIYNRDTALVSCSDESERNSIAKGFGVKRLDLTHKDALELVEKTCLKMKKSRFKSRVVFYYFMAKEIGSTLD